MSRHSPLATGLSSFLLPSALVCATAVGWGEASLSLQNTIAQALIYVIATVGLYVFVGNSGIFSFGHVAFMMVGAYTSGILAMTPEDKGVSQPGMPHFLMAAHLPPYLACLAGGAVAALTAAVLSIPLIRLNGIAASLTSFAVLQIVYVISSNWQTVTNGPSGLAAIPMLDNITTLWMTVVGSIAMAITFQRSRWGRRLRASREDEVAALATGIGIRHERRLAFVLSAFIIGVAGGLYAQLLGALVPQTLYLTATAQILIMLVVGGTNSLAGAVCGSLFISALAEILRNVQAGADIAGMHVKGPIGTQQVGLALVMLVTLLAFPRGLTRSREMTWLSRPLDATGLWMRSHLPGTSQRARDRTVAAPKESGRQESTHDSTGDRTG